MSSENKERKIRNNYMVANFLVALFYVWFYDFLFCNYISDLFGTRYFPMIAQDRLISFVVGAFPILFYRGLRNVASIFSIFVFIFAYVPFNETLSFCGYGAEYNDYRVVFFISMCVFFLTDNIELWGKPFFSKSVIPYDRFEKVTFLIWAIVVFLNFRNLHFTNFMENREDLYDLREDLVVVGGTPIVYLIFWLKNVLLPLLFVVSLQRKETIKTIVCFVACMTMYMIDQQKITFIAPFVILSLYAVYRMNEKILRNYYHFFIMFTLVLFSFFCYCYMYASESMYELAAILIMRTQCIEGMELNTYFDFFGHDGEHPYTFYSHVGLVNLFTNSYPYDTALGRAVTNHGANANGMFWLMDGIAADGLFGVVFIGIIFVLVKSFFNGIKYKCDVLLFSIISMFAMSMTMNVSLFTSMFSCGWILFYLLFVFVDFRGLLNSEVTGLENSDNEMYGRSMPSVGWTFGRELSRFGVRGGLSLHYIRHLMKRRIKR